MVAKREHKTQLLAGGQFPDEAGFQPISTPSPGERGAKVQRSLQSGAGRRGQWGEIDSRRSIRRNGKISISVGKADAFAVRHPVDALYIEQNAVLLFALLV